MLRLCQDNQDLMLPVPCPACRGIMGRGIDGVKLFNNKEDREDFLKRLADQCEADALYQRLGPDEQSLSPFAQNRKPNATG